MDIANFTIRPFEPNDVDYVAAVKFVNQDWPNEPSTVEIWKHNDSTRNPKYLDRRYIGEIENKNGKQIVAVGFVDQRIRSKKSGKYYIDFCIDQKFKNQGLDEPLYTHMVTALADKNPVELMTGTREDNPQRIELFQQKGFLQSMRSPSSELDVSSFDFAPFARYSEKVSASGITIVNVQELQISDSDWMQKLYDLEMTIVKDIPSTEEFTPPKLDKYAKNFERINFRADAWFVALDDNDYVGMSSLWPNKVLEDMLHVGITGVLPSHRRRRIGTVLKLKTIAFAQAYGANTIETGNEENNPMYALNIMLGFKPTPAWLTFEKVL